jgi:hypothetical protein
MNGIKLKTYPFTAVTGVRTPLGTPYSRQGKVRSGLFPVFIQAHCPRSGLGYYFSAGESCSPSFMILTDRTPVVTLWLR